MASRYTPNWFVGLPVPAGQWYEKILQSDPPDELRLFHPEDVHLTVAFFGSYKADRFKAVSAQMQAIRHVPFEITLGQLIALPTAEAFSALSFELEQGREEAVRLLSRERNSLCHTAGTKPDLRDPLPHITLGRAGRKATWPEKQKILDWADSIQVPSETLLLDRIALYTWADDRSLRQFKVLYEVKWD